MRREMTPLIYIVTTKLTVFRAQCWELGWKSVLPFCLWACNEVHGSCVLMNINVRTDIIRRTPTSSTTTHYYCVKNTTLKVEEPQRRNSKCFRISIVLWWECEKAITKGTHEMSPASQLLSCCSEYLMQSGQKASLVIIIRDPNELKHSSIYMYRPE